MLLDEQVRAAPPGEATVAALVSACAPLASPR
jgi:hypothetical protein